MGLTLKELCDFINYQEFDTVAQREKELIEMALNHSIAAYQEMAILALDMLPILSSEVEAAFELICADPDRARDPRVLETVRECLAWRQYDKK